MLSGKIVLLLGQKETTFPKWLGWLGDAAMLAVLLLIIFIHPADGFGMILFIVGLSPLFALFYTCSSLATIAGHKPTFISSGLAHPCFVSVADFSFEIYLL